MRELNTRADRTIADPAGDIWACRLDFLHLPECDAAVEGIEHVDGGGPDGAGARYRFDLVTGARSSPIEPRVTEMLEASSDLSVGGEVDRG